MLLPQPSVASAQRREFVRNDMLQVRAPALCFYVLRDANGLYLIADLFASYGSIAHAPPAGSFDLGL